MIIKDQILNNRNYKSIIINVLSLVIILISCIILISFTKIDIKNYSDIFNYENHYKLSEYYGYNYIFRDYSYEILYEILVYISNKIGINFLLFISIIFSTVLAAYFKFSAIESNSLVIGVISVCIFLASPMANSFHYVFIRQSISIIILLSAIIIPSNEKTVRFFALAVIATGFHTSAAVFFFVVYLARNINSRHDLKLILIFSFSCILYLLNAFIALKWIIIYLSGILGLSYHKYAGYSSYVIGFKIQFMALTLIGFSAFIINLYFNRKISKVARYFLISSCIYMICSSIPYYDRLAVYSWIIIPALLAQSGASLIEKFPRNYSNRTRYL